MSYSTPAYAKALTCVDIQQELLDEAQQIIHNYTWYRWEETAATDVLSSKDSRVFYGRGSMVRGFSTNDYSSVLLPRSEFSIFLKMPVITMTSVKIDGNALTEGTDYELRKDIGELRLTSFSFMGSASLTGTGDIEIIYTYGFTSAHDAFKMVQGAEARIALLLKNNPLLLQTVSLQGDSVNYGDALARILQNVPKSFNVRMYPR